MLKHPMLFLILFISTLVSCFGEGENEGVRTSLEGIETIQIDHGSTKLILKSTDEDELEASLLSAYDQPEIERGERQMNIRLNRNFIQSLNVWNSPQLQVIIPSNFTGEIIAIGSSGKIEAVEFVAPNFQSNGTSGGISLDIVKLQGNISIARTSGHVKMTLSETAPQLIGYYNQVAGDVRSIFHSLTLKKITRKRPVNRETERIKFTSKRPQGIF